MLLEALYAITALVNTAWDMKYRVAGGIANVIAIAWIQLAWS